MPETGATQSVQRTLCLLEQLAAHGAMGVTELATAVGLSKATVFRLLNTLAACGYVCKDPTGERYTLTLKLVSLSGQLLERLDVRGLIHGDLQALSAACGETVHLVRQEAGQIVYIDKVESHQNAVRMVSRIGLRGDLTTTGVGKAILATWPDSEIRQLWQQAAPAARTEHTITDWEAFAAEIARIRRCGYAEDREENELGVRCVAAACPDLSGRAQYAFSVSAPAMRMSDARVAEIAAKVLKAGRQIGRKLWGQPENGGGQ